ncbi:MAG TPA: hypothetical protein VLL54_12670 [Pyrinomonadaceae bacterium]|nr:hypothetical protein [Pyrinomonadaceae bacterium]
MKFGSRFQCAVAGFVLVVSAFSYVLAQTASPTPDPFVAQVTSSPTSFVSVARDISANGRFVVFDSNGDLDTQNRRNADGNREVFLFDYAQRRIFQITNTKNVQKPPASPTPTPTPTPTPSPTASPTPTVDPTPADPAQVKVEISSTRPVISLEPALMAGGKRVYTIVFTSNSPDPSNFDGTDSAAFATDINQEIWVYRLPQIDDQFDLSSGDDIPLTPLTGGTFRRITDTPSSRVPRLGANPPDIIDDNRDVTISDDGNTLAFISTRNLVPPANACSNPELFLVRTTGGFADGTNTLVQATTTQVPNCGIGSSFQQNPSLSSNGSVVSFLSTANLATNNTDKNPEVFVGDFSGSAFGNVRQITKTQGGTANRLTFGRRLSRDGKFVAYESRAEDPTANSATNNPFFATFVSDVPVDTMTNSVAKRAAPRAAADSQIGDVPNQNPTFTDYDSSLAPHSLIFVSALNFKTDGTFPAADQDSTGLNSVPSGSVRPSQVFLTQVPVTTSSTFRRLTKIPPVGFAAEFQPFVGTTQRRIAFTLPAVELGGGNTITKGGVNDFSSEIYYVLTPNINAESTAELKFFTGASNWGPFASASPAASPTPTPSATPTPTPGIIPAGLAPGELSVVQSTVGLAASDKNAGLTSGPETGRTPILPIELNGVSVSVNGAAAGLYFVGDAPSEGVTYVTPIGLNGVTAPVVINNAGTAFRGFVQIVPAQPDIFNPPTNGPGGVAMACNVTATGMSGSGCITGPFKVTSADAGGTQVPTKLEIWTTGMRLSSASETKVSFISGMTTIDVTPTLVVNNQNMFGWDLITIELPASLAGMAPIDYKIIVTVTKTTAFTSRAVDTAPTITIIP